jgi:hypothetical protein
MLENEQRIEHTIAEEKSERERGECPTGYLLDTFSSRRWRPSTNVRLSHLLSKFFFLLFVQYNIMNKNKFEERKEKTFFSIK